MSNLNEKEKLLMIELVRDLADLNLFEYLDNRVRFDMWENDQFFAYHHLGIKDIRWGATKICIDAEDFDWVIKIGFNDIAYDNRNDYCDREYQLYRAAADKGLDRYFPETLKLCEYNGQNIYIQRKLYTCEDIVSDRWVDSVEAALLEYGTISVEDEGSDEYVDAIENELDYMTEFDRLYPLFGDEKDFDELMDFVDYYEINDFHEGNFGTDENGDIFILDFSGYL